MMPLCHILIDGNCLTEIEFRLKSIATDFFVSVKMINCKALILAQTDRSLAHLLIRGDNSRKKSETTERCCKHPKISTLLFHGNKRVLGFGQNLALSNQ